MARTYKDRPYKVRFPQYYDDSLVEVIPYTYHSVYEEHGSYTAYWHKDRPGAKTKKKRTASTDWYWLRSTPSWWTRMTFHKPQRCKANKLMHKALLSELEVFDVPDCGNKPHNYYY